MTPRKAGRLGYHDGLMIGALRRGRDRIDDVLARRLNKLAGESYEARRVYEHGFRYAWNRPTRRTSGGDDTTKNTTAY